MRYSIAFVSTLVAVASAQATGTDTSAASSATPTSGTDTGSGSNQANAIVPITSIPAGTATSVKWTNPSSGDCTLILRKGTSDNLDTMFEVGTAPCSAGSISVNIAASKVASGSDYAFEIKSSASGVSSNFSPQFAITGGTGTGSSGSTDSSSATSSGELPTASGNSTDTNSTTAEMPSPTSDSGDESTTQMRTSRPTSTRTQSSSSSTNTSSAATGAFKVSFAALFGGLMVAMFTL